MLPESPSRTTSARSDSGTFHVAPSACGELRTQGYVALDDLWPAAVGQTLATEADDLWNNARPPAIGPGRRVAPTRPVQLPTLLSGGEALSALHHDLVGVARSLTGQLLEPSFAFYYFYERNDEVRLHYDTDQCDLTMITEVLGDLGPLHMHPELQDLTTDDLFSLEDDPTWDRESGLPIHHPRSGLTAFRGRRLPHHRPGRPLDGLGAVAALHYRARY
jgi:hypothetical protein